MSFIQSITYKQEAIEKIVNSRFFEFLVSTEKHSPELLNELTYISDVFELDQFLNFVNELDYIVSNTKSITQSVTFTPETMTFINELIANADDWHK